MQNTDIAALAQAAVPHVAFDGWSAAALAGAAADLGLPLSQARALAPRGGIDLAVAYHRMGDAGLAARLAAEDLSALRYRDRVARAIWLRLDGLEKEAVRRATALFALPQHAAEGAALIWATSDAIWRALGDTSTDLNWYTKRGTLAAVWGATVIYWLGDHSPGAEATRAFIDRRIDDVMMIEKAKASPLLRPFGRLAALVRAPHSPPADLPGHWR